MIMRPVSRIPQGAVRVGGSSGVSARSPVASRGHDDPSRLPPRRRRPPARRRPPVRLRTAALSPPIVLLGLGALIGLLPAPDDVGVLPDRPPGVRRAPHRVHRAGRADGCRPGARPAAEPAVVRRRGERWGATWRLLAIAMPLSHRRGRAAGLVGHGAWPRPRPCCSAPRSRRPTRCWPRTCRSRDRPRPRSDEDEIDEDDEVRFALTSEAGLNDGLAFPFVYAAILLATLGRSPSGACGGSPGTWSARSSSAS